MTHQAHGSSIVRARLTRKIEFHTAFDIKSLPSTSWLGWVEKIFKDQQWGPRQGKVLNTHCPHLKHYLAASAWSQCIADITVMSALSLTTVPLQNQQLHHVPYLTPTSSHCRLHARCPFCHIPLALLVAEPGEAHAALLAIPGWLVGQKMDPAWKAVRGHLWLKPDI